MGNNNNLTDIYTNNVLLSEKKDASKLTGKKNVVTKKGDIGKAELVKGGPEAVKGIKKPETKKLMKDNINTEYTESAFEKLFKATITENFGQETPASADVTPEVEVPTTDQDLSDEVTDETHDEVGDLAEELGNVIDKLQAILAKIGGETPAEDVEELAGEAVEAEELGHALHNLKKGTELANPKGKNEVSGAVKVAKGKANDGELTNEPELKELGGTEELDNPKKKPEPKSSIKVGDFFK